jgi:hypothetical protein
MDAERARGGESASAQQVDRGGAGPGADSSAPEQDVGFYSVSQLMTKYGIPKAKRSAFDTALHRWRQPATSKDWQEPSDDKPYLHRASAVAHLIHRYRSGEM